MSAMDHYLKVGTNVRISDEAIAVENALKEERVRIGTLLKTDNVAFLLGAGASMDAGGVGLGSIPIVLERALLNRADECDPPDPEWKNIFYASVSALTGQQYDLENRTAAILAEEGSNPDPIPINVEAYMSHLHMWLASMGGDAVALGLKYQGDTKLVVKKEALDKLISAITEALTKLLDLPTEGKEEELETHRQFIKKILTRPLNLRRANIVTLNYDTLLEQAADAEGAVLVDGFVGTLKRIFRPESYDLDFYFPAQTTEGRVHRFDRALHLYKLHGSLNWKREAADWHNPYGLTATFVDQSTPKEDVLIYPTPLKYGQALGLPYSELFRRFGVAIAQPQSVLFTIGYGFGDEHVNALIRQALAVPSFTLVIVDPVPNSDFVKELELIEDERVWFIKGWQLGTMKHFVKKLLPDLGDFEFDKKVVDTYNALDKVRTDHANGAGKPDETRQSTE